MSQKESVKIMAIDFKKKKKKLKEQPNDTGDKIP